MRLAAARPLLLALYALAGVASAAEEVTPGMGHWHGWHGHGYTFWWIFPLMMFIVFFVVMSRNRGGWWGPSRWRRGYPESRDTIEDDRDATPESALDVLNKRYARGEIDKDEYEEKKTAITSSTV